MENLSRINEINSQFLLFSRIHGGYDRWKLTQFVVVFVPLGIEQFTTCFFFYHIYYYFHRDIVRVIFVVMWTVMATSYCCSSQFVARWFCWSLYYQFIVVRDNFVVCSEIDNNLYRLWFMDRRAVASLAPLCVVEELCGKALLAASRLRETSWHRLFKFKTAFTVV